MFDHITVLREEAVEGLNIKPNGTYVDCTLGGGGHSELILSKLNNGGKLYAFDQDQSAITHALEKFKDFPDQFIPIKSNFRYLEEQLSIHNVKEIDGILFDLGVSSPQLDNAKRGFSYHQDADLDMRMDQEGAISAYDIVNSWEYHELVRIFFQYGEEKFSKQIARKIEAYRQERPIKSTLELVDIIKDAIPAPARRTGGHPAKRIFQAIRIAVNDEIKAFEDALESAISVVAKGGRISVITFHSLEDRLCKTIFKQASQGPELPPGLPVIPKGYEAELKIITRKPIIPSDEEIQHNKRARSAKLRIAEKQ